MSPWSSCPPRTLESWISWWLMPAAWLSAVTWSCSHLPQHPWTCSPTMAPVATHSPWRCTAMRADTKGPQRRDHHFEAADPFTLPGSRGSGVVIGWFVDPAWGVAVVGALRVPCHHLLPAAERDLDAGRHRPGHGSLRIQRDVLREHQLVLHDLPQPAAVRGPWRHRRLRGQPDPAEHLEAVVRAPAGIRHLPSGAGLRAGPGGQGQRQPQLDPHRG